ncbi:hypothetical protein KC887_01660 [Candidatus Kaiserbacteria bacterium]|nr:hypothetical protein [Candidatus Kaiserbacteria bacterium]
MNFWQFALSFLYVRNWHTGKRELSRPRLYVFLGVVAITVFALVLINFLQSPVEVFIK